MDLTELTPQYEQLKKKAMDLIGFLQISQKIKRLDQINSRLTDSKIWNEPAKSAKLMQEKKRLEDTVNVQKKVNAFIENIDTYLELLEEGENPGGELEEEISQFENYVDNMEIRNYLSGSNDENNAFLSIHPGAGGTESQDWAEILLRMYLRFTERQDMQSKIVECQPGEEAGIKSVTIRVEGDYAYGYLKQEIGVHRLVRISPFDANSRRHTSFAAVFVYPEISDSLEININPQDLRIDTYRASGKGGQHVNTTDSAVRIVHLPSNTIAQCQSERSQHQNKDRAMKILKSKLYDLERQKKEKEKNRLENEKGEIAWGNQIRSYVLQPYTMVKDNRTEVEVGDAQGVLDGDIDAFLEAFLRYDLERKTTPAESREKGR